MNKYKALLCDVDGTLIPNQLQGIPSEKVIDAIARASKHLHVGIATARPITELNNLFNLLPLTGPSVINGGAQVVNLPERVVVWEKLMNREDVKKVAEVFSKHQVKFIVFDNDRDYEYNNSYIPNRPIQIYAQAAEAAVIDKVLSDLYDLSDISAHAVKSWAFGLQDILVNHAGATKQHGVFEVAKILNISTHEIIGIGDGYNDFPLLMACGLKIAMGNAPDELKAIADYVAPSVDDDGVAHIIEKFIL